MCTGLTKGLIVLAALAPFAAQADVQILHSDEGDLALGGMAQLIALGQRVDAPVTDKNRAYLFMKEARLRASGRYEEALFNLELGLGGEDTVVATTGVSLSLLDLSVKLPLHFLGPTHLTVGQFKVPFGREALTYSRDAQFMDRSIVDLGFRVGRDVGAALTFQPGPFTAIAGVFTGGGRDVPPQHYLPERLGRPMVALRLGYGTVDDDPFALKHDLGVEKPKAALFVNGLYTEDSTIGHSTVLNVKLADKSLLLDSNWNPYIGAKPLAQGEYWQLGADAAVRYPLGKASLAGEAELDWAGYDNAQGSLHVGGARAQAGIHYLKGELALRYAVLFPDAKFAVGGAQVSGSAAIHQLDPSFSYYFDGQKLKLVADLPLLIQAPVFYEPGVGAYVATELPDQSAVLAKGGTVSRQNVLEARVMFQAAF